MIKTNYSKISSEKGFLRWLKVMMLFVISTLSSVDVNAQAGIYGYSATTGTSLSYSPATVVTTASDPDDGYMYITLPSPYSFTFNGVNYTQLTVSTNGYIVPGNVITTGTSSNLFTGLSGNPEFVVFGRDGNLNAANGGSMIHGPTTSAGVYGVTFNNFSGAGSGATSSTIFYSAQVLLYGPSSSNPGRIEIIYGSSLGTPGSNGEIGIRDAAGTYLNGRNGLNNNTTTAAAFPAAGVLYQFNPPPPCPTPIAQPTGLVISSTTALTATGSFTAASPASSGYLVVRYPADSIPTAPVNGATYAIGATLGAGRVVDNDNNTTFTATGLNSNTTYDFYVYSYSSGAACTRTYLALSPAEVTATTAVCGPKPTEQPSALTLVVLSATSISGSFTFPSIAADGYLIVRYPADSATTNPVDNTIYTAGNTIGLGTVIQANTSNTFTNTGLTFNTNYDYYVYSYRSSGECSRSYLTVTPLKASAATPPPTPAGCPTTYSPANNAQNVLTNSVLTWSGAAGDPAPRFNVYFGTNLSLVSTFDISVRVLNASTATSFTPTLALNTTYFWVVVPYNVADSVLTCTVNQFTTQGQLAPSCATGFTPASGATNVAFNATLSWATAFGNPATFGYDVYLGTNFTDVSNLNPSTRVATLQTATTFTPAVSFIPGATYFWLVVPANSIGSASGCSPNSFTVRNPTSIVSTATGGLWNDVDTWVGGVIPGSTDNVTIANGAIVTINTAPITTNLTIGTGGSGASPAILQWSGANALNVRGNLTIGTNGFLYPFTSATGGQTINIGGNFTNNGYANLAIGSTIIAFNGSQLGSTGSQTLGGTGIFQGDGTFGIIRQLTFASNTTLNITTTQNLCAYGFTLTAGTLNTNGKLRVDNIPQVYGGTFNRQVNNVFVSAMGSSLTTAPAVFGSVVNAIQVNTTSGVVGTRYFNGNNVYLCTVAGTFSSLPTGTAASPINVGATVIWVGTLGTIGTPWITGAPIAGTQYFYGGNLYTATATTASATPPTHTTGLVGVWQYAGTPAQVSLNFVGGKVRSLNLVNAGSGYILTAPGISFSQGAIGASGTLPSATAIFIQQIVGPANSLTTKSPSAIINGGLNIRSDRSVGALATSNGGFGYTAAPSVGFSLPTGQLNLVTNQGAGYTSAPTITLVGGGSGTGFTAGALTPVIQGGRLIALVVSTAGAGYTSTPTITITGGGATTNATAAFPANTIPTATATITNRSITGFTITNPGLGYTTAPTVTLLGTPPTTGAATAPTAFLGLYNLSYGNLVPSITNPEVTMGVEVPTNRLINVLSIGSTARANGNAKIKLDGNLDLVAASPLVFTTGTVTESSYLNLNGFTLEAKALAHTGVGSVGAITNNQYGHIFNGTYRFNIATAGNVTRTAPFRAPISIQTGSTPTLITTGSTITSISITDFGAPSGSVSGTGRVIGTRSYRVRLNTGAQYGLNPIASLTYTAGDSIPTSTFSGQLLVGISQSISGPWSAVSTTAGGNVFLTIPAGSKASTTTAPGPFVHTLDVDDFFAFINTTAAPSVTSFTPSDICSGGTSVTITGTGFKNVTSVKFNGVEAQSFTVTDTTVITAVSPIGTTAGVITILAAGQTATSAAYTVTQTSDLVVSSSPSNSLVCNVGGSVTINLIETGTPTATSVSWVGPSLNTTTGLSVIASPTNSSSYTYTANYASGCTITKTVGVGVLQVAPISPSASPANSCFVAGNTVTLNSNLSSTNFAVNSIPYAPALAPGNVTRLVQQAPSGTLYLHNPAYQLGGEWEDGGSPDIPIGFNYNYFGQVFDKLAIGSNGQIKFGPVPGYSSSPGSLGQFTFVSTNGVIFPNIANPENIISLFSADMGIVGNYTNPSSGINFWTEGVAPLRRFVVEYKDWGNFGSFNTVSSQSTVQCMLYETTGIVEIHILKYSTGTKTIGLQNGDRTIGAVPPGRQLFSGGITTPEAWRFIPPTNWQYSWTGASLSNNNQTSTTFTPATAGTYNFNLTATNPLTGCSASSPVTVQVNPTPAAPTVTGTLTVCGSGSTALFSSQPANGNTIQWYNDPLSGTLLNTGVLYVTPVITSSTTYYAAQNTGLCTSARTPVTVTISTPPVLEVSDPINCAGVQAARMDVTSITSSFNTYVWSPLTGLFQDVNLTIPYTGQNLTTVYADLNHPSGIRKYYCNANDFVSGCGTRDSSEIRVQPATATISASTNPVCITGSSTLTLNSATPIATGTIQWQESNDNISFTNILGATGLTYETGSLSATKHYRVVIVNSLGATCITTAPITLNYFNPTITSTTSGSRCGTGSVQLSAVPASAGTIYWYGSNISNTVIDSGAVFNSPAISATQLFYAALSISGCVGNRVPATATINPGPNVTTSADQSVCNNGVATISVTSTLSDFDQYVWTPAANLFTDAAATVNYTPGSSATTVYARTTTAGLTNYIVTAFNTSTQCGGVDTSAVRVMPATATLTATTLQVCNSGIDTIKINPTVYAGGTIQWEQSSDNIIFTPILGANDSIYISGTLTDTVYYRAVVSVGANVCFTTSSIQINVVTPTVVSTVDYSQCGPTGTPLIVANPSLNADIRWYSTLTGGISLATNDTLTPTVTAVGTTTFYAAALFNGCESSPRTPVLVTRITGNVSSSQSAICNSGTVTVSITNTTYTGVTIQWQESTDSLTFTDISGANSFSYLTPTLTDTMYYRVKFMNGATECYVTPFRMVPVNNPAINTVTNGSINCNVGTLTMSATVNFGNTAKWYATLTGGSALATSLSFSPINPPSGVTTYYVAAVAGICESSPRVAVTGTNVAVAPVTVTPSQSVCNITITPLSVTSTLANYNNYVWTPVTDLFTDALATIPYVAGSSATTVYALRTTAGSIEYTVSATNTTLGCLSSAKTTLTVQPGSATISANPASSCISNSVTLSLTPSTGYVAGTIQWEQSTDGVAFTPISGATGTQYGAVGNTDTMFYRVVVKNSPTGTTCFTTPIFTLNYYNPSVTSSTGASRCGPGSLTLSATVAGADTIKWYSVAVGGNAIATGSSFTTPTIFATRTYFVTGKVGTCETSRIAVVATIASPPALTLTSPQVVCNNAIAMYQVTSNLSDYNSYVWSPATNLFTDASATIPYIAGTSATTVYARTTNEGTYTYSVFANNPTSLCSESASTTFTVQRASATITAVPASVCISGTTVLTLNPTSPYASGSIQWQRSPDNIVAYSNIAGAIGTSITTPVLATTRYYRAQVKNGAGDVCFSTNPFAVSVNSPSLTTTSTVTRCGPGPFSLTAVPSPGATIRWFADATTGTVLFTGNTYNTPTILASRSYFVDALTGTCSSGRTRVDVIVNPGPTLALTQSQTVCNNDIATITATTGLASFDSLVWSPATNLFTNASATIPYVAGTHANVVYFRSSTPGTNSITCNAFSVVGNCANVAATSVIVNPSTIVANISQSSLCLQGTVTLSVTPIAGFDLSFVQWQSSTDSITFNDISGAIGGTYTSGTINTKTFFRAILRNSLGAVCVNSDVVVNVQTPVVTSTTPGSRCGIGTVTLGATAFGTEGLNWYTTATGGLPVGTGTSFTTPVISSTTNYFVASSSGGISNVSVPGGITWDQYTTVGAFQTTTITGASMVFDALTNITLASLDFYPSAAIGSPYTIEVRQSSGSGALIASFSGVTTVQNTGTPSVAQTANVNFNIPAGTNYVIGFAVNPNTWRGNVTNFPYPYVLPGYLNIQGSSFGTSPGTTLIYQYYLYNFKVSTGCESLRTPVTATVFPPPALTVTASDTVCNNTITQLDVTSTLSDFDTYVWSPITGLFSDASATIPYVAGSNLSTVYARSTTAGTVQYIVTGTDTVTNCVNQDTLTYTTLPASVSIVSSPVAICVSGSATLSLAPVAGFNYLGSQWEVSTNNIGFSPVGAANATTITTPVINDTLYYRTTIKNRLGATCLTPTYQLDVNDPIVLSTVPGSRCGYGSVLLQASGTTATNMRWYNVASGGTSIGTGSSFNTPNINATTTYYVEAASNGFSLQTAFNGAPTVSTTTTNAGIIVTFNVPTTLQSVDVYSELANTVTLELRNSSGAVIAGPSTFSVPATSLTVPTKLNLGWSVPAGIDHRIMVTAQTGGLGFHTGTFPIDLGNGVGTITNGAFTTGTSTLNYFIYNLVTTVGCASPRVPVVATVTPAPSVSVTGTTTICSGQSATINATSANDPNYSYMWNSGAVDFILGPVSTIYSNDFSSGVGALGTLTGNASLVGGELQLNPNTANQNGALTIDGTGTRADSLSVAFDLRVSPANGADGVSYSYTNNGTPGVNSAMNSENGTGSNLKLAFVSYTNGASVKGIYLMYNATANEQSPTTSGVIAYSNDTTWLPPIATGPVPVRLNVSASGLATVTLNGVPVTGMTNVQLPAAWASANKSTWKHYFKARTGAITELHAIDNVVIRGAESNPVPQAGAIQYGSSITVSPTTTTTYTLLATDTTGGVSAGCAVLATHTVTVNPIPVAPTITASSATVCDGASVTLTALSTTTGIASVGTGTVENVTVGSTPYSGNWEGSKIQYLITAAELTASNIIAGPITSLAFNVSVAGNTYPMSAYSIKLGSTAATSLTNYQTGLTTVYTAPSAFNPVVGWNTYTFTAPFTWNGTSNIIVEVCHNNDPTGSCASCWGGSATVLSTTTAYQSVYGQYADNTTPTNPWDLCSQISTGTVPTTSLFDRPNMRFGADISPTGSLTYNWSTAQTGSVITVTPPSGTTTYTATAVTTAGCNSLPTSINISSNATPTPTIVNFAGSPIANGTVLCSPDTINLFAKDLTGSYVGGYPSGTIVEWIGYAITGDPTTTPVNSNAGSSFQAKITIGSTGCIGLSNTVNVQTRSVNVSPTIIPAACGSSSGEITVNVTNVPVPPYRYVWSGPLGFTSDVTSASTTNTITGLAPGTYTLNIFDNVGNGLSCSSTGLTFVVTTSAVDSVTTSATSVTCNGFNDGSATATVYGGTSPYSYLWSNGGITQTISSLVAGTYTVTITDALGCTATNSVIVTEPTAISATVSATNACFSLANGSASAVISGGTLPYSTVLWLTPDLTTVVGSGNSAIDLAAGSYILYVVDANNCIGQFPVVVNETSAIVVSSFLPTNGAVGSSVVITGSGFLGATGVSFNGTAATVYTVNSDLQITATVPAGATSGPITVNVGPCSGVSTGSFTVINTATFNLKAFMQGYYAGAGTMLPVLTFQGVSIDPNEMDTVTVQLRDQFDPTIISHTGVAVMQIDGTASFTFPGTIVGGNYYVAVFHRNAVQTWSASPVTFATTTSYDFTTASTQAYLDNQVEVEPGVWAFYTGDINQDENIDISDSPILEGDVANGVFGYFATDLNGDGNVDISDSPILENNVGLGIFSAHP